MFFIFITCVFLGVVNPLKPPDYLFLLPGLTLKKFDILPMQNIHVFAVSLKTKRLLFPDTKLTGCLL
jgi:hypothetical protein